MSLKDDRNYNYEKDEDEEEEKEQEKDEDEDEDEDEDFKCPPQHVPWSNPNEERASQNDEKAVTMEEAFLLEDEHKIEVADPQTLAAEEEFDIEHPESSGDQRVESSSSDVDVSPDAASLVTEVPHATQGRSQGRRTQISQRTFPDAYREGGPDNQEEGYDEDEFTIESHTEPPPISPTISPTITAEPVDTAEEERRRQDDIKKAKEEGRAEERQNAVVAEIVPELVSNRSRRWKLAGSFFALIAICILALILGLSVGLSGNKSRPTFAPTEFDRFEATVDFLSTITDADFSEDSNTPQYQAAYWIAWDDDYLLDIPGADDWNGDATDYAISAYWEFVERWVAALIYYQMNGPSWDIQLGWLSDTSICEWQQSYPAADGGADRKAGIGCSDERVTDIALPGNRLKGSIPSEIGLLDQMISLNLNSNQITGALPSELENLSNLILLALQNNQLYGTIPSWISDYPQLEVLHLGNNKFSSSLPPEFSKLTSLQSMALSKNEITGDLSSLEALPYLAHIYADRNLFEGTLEETLRYMNNVTELDLSSNKLRGNIPEYVLEMTNLEFLDLHDNRLAGVIPNVIPKGSKLKYLVLHINQLDGTIPTSIANAQNLTHLDLSGNYLEGTMTTEIGSLSNLKYLFLSENRFTNGPLPSWLEGMTNLEELSLKEIALTGTIPSFISTMTKLVLLDLGKNSLTGSVPAHKIGTGVSQLRFLLLNRNKLNGTIPADFSRLSSLEMLMLDHNGLTGDMDDVCGLEIGPSIVIADCAGATPEIKCECCSTCCASDDDECNDQSSLGNFDPSWENSFVRKFYEFGPSITFVGTARR